MSIRTSNPALYAPFSASYLLRMLLLQAFLFAFCGAQSQSVTEIITDYSHYWKSSAAANNSIKPDSNHNLLAFTYQGQRYSTGVNDALLSASGELFTAGDYRALPVTAAPAANSGTKLALGALYDGVANGAGSTPPANNIPFYLTDGIKGLNIGTGVANLPSGALSFSVSGMQQMAVGDGVPDILITQIADPSAASDRYQFTDAAGNVVGNAVNIVVQNLPALGTWTGDFYDADRNPPVLTSGFTQTDRMLRIWAADFSDFGITMANINQITGFSIFLNGASDVAFVAYNHAVVQVVMPVTLNYFKSSTSNQQPHLSWQTAQESGSSHFVVEASTDGVHFSAADSVPAAGNSTTPRNYMYACTSDKAVVYYRLKQVDMDGRFAYSEVVLMKPQQTVATALQLYPNPAKGRVWIVCPEAAAGLRVFAMQGAMVKSVAAFEGGKISLSLTGLPPGIYTVQCSGASGNVYTSRLVVE